MSMFSEYDDYIDATDLAFKIGIAIVYGLPKRATPKQIKELTCTWGKMQSLERHFAHKFFHMCTKQINKCIKNCKKTDFFE